MENGERSEAFLKALAEFEAGKWLLMVDLLRTHFTPEGLASLANRFHDPNLEFPAAPFKSVLKMRNPLPLMCVQPGYLQTDARTFLEEFRAVVEKSDATPASVFSPALRGFR
ncbi:hypothetical protein J4419_00075 [Candidatus Woesearchaeota archaeon]|nr:hypothetical protein [Candidatus Woesearchaeota archaeon]